MAALPSVTLPLESAPARGFVLGGPSNGECFRAHVELPVLKPGEILIMDSLGSDIGGGA